MNPVLSQMLVSGMVITAHGQSIPLGSSISDEEGRALQHLIRRYKPRTTLEIGLAYGTSALFICDALTDVSGHRHIVIDPAQDGWQRIGLLNLERAGYGPLVEFHEQPSHRALPALEGAGRRVDFAFIDGWHTFDYVMVDFFYVDLLLNVGGVIAIDDAFSYPAIRKLVRYIATHRRYRPLETGVAARPSVARRLLNLVAAPLRTGPLRRAASRVIRPEVMEPDATLGLFAGELVAFEKLGDDLLGDGSAGTRRWDQHHDF
jgi:predicted O-methyltransferase YrrM